MRSYQKLAAVDTGFRTDHLLSAEIELPQPRYDDSSPATNHFYEQLLDKLNTTPGALSAGTTTQTPLKSSEVVTRFAIEGTPRPQAGAYPVAQIRYVSPAFFRTIGLRLLEGRVFNQQDIDQNRSLFIVNETFAKRYLAGRNPIGAKVIVGVLSPHPDVTPVIGVVADAHDLGVDRNPQPELYIPGFGLHAVLLVRSNAVADTGSLETIVRQAVHSVSPDQPVFHIQSADAILADSLARPRMTPDAARHLRRHRPGPRRSSASPASSLSPSPSAPARSASAWPLEPAAPTSSESSSPRPPASPPWDFACGMLASRTCGARLLSTPAQQPAL